MKISTFCAAVRAVPQTWTTLIKGCLTTGLKWLGKVPEVDRTLASTLVLPLWHGVVSLVTKITCEILAGWLRSSYDLVDSL